VFSRDVARVVGVSLDICAYIYICISIYLYILQASGRIVTVPPVQMCSLEMSLALWVFSYICAYIYICISLFYSGVWPDSNSSASTSVFLGNVASVVGVFVRHFAERNSCFVGLAP